jgi:trans-aconitate methyltransferase
LAKHGQLLQRLEAPSFVVGLLTEQVPDWTDDHWHTLATERRAERERRRHLELPSGFDAALQVMTAERLMEAGRSDEASPTMLPTTVRPPRSYFRRFWLRPGSRRVMVFQTR